MPKVKSYATPWLSGSAPGRQLFTRDDDSPLTTALSSNKNALPGPRRTIAKRGSEVFVACGKEIRWGDLASLKDQWTTSQTRDGGRGRSSLHSRGIDRDDSSDDGFDLANATNIRVSNRPHRPFRSSTFKLTPSYRQSRRDVPRKFDNSSYPPMATISLSSQHTRFTFALSPIRHT